MEAQWKELGASIRARNTSGSGDSATQHIRRAIVEVRGETYRVLIQDDEETPSGYKLNQKRQYRLRLLSGRSPIYLLEDLLALVISSELKRNVKDDLILDCVRDALYQAQDAVGEVADAE